MLSPVSFDANRDAFTWQSPLGEYVARQLHPGFRVHAPNGDVISTMVETLPAARAEVERDLVEEMERAA